MHMFRGKTNMFREIASLPRLNTYLLCIAQVPRLKMELHETSKLFHGSAAFPCINTTVFRINTHLLYRNKPFLSVNLKHHPDCTPEFTHATRLGRGE